MASVATVPISEYVRASYRPDRDYIDGEVLERNSGEFEHSSAQREILLFLATNYPELRKRILPEQRVQVSATRFRIPDVCILAAGAARQNIILTPPDLCIEILSPEDTLKKTLDRIRDYFAMGVPLCWIIDPVGRVGWITTQAANQVRLEEATDGILRADGIVMPLAAVFE